MFKQPYRTFALILLMLATLLSGQASAQDNRQKQINQAQAVQKAQQKGQVLKVRQSKNHYQIKVLQKSGRVITVNVDKKSGRVTQSR